MTKPDRFRASMNHHLQHVKNWPELAATAGYRSKTLAALCHVSVRQLERFFLKKFSETPHRWLHTTRLNLAVELLRDGTSVKETAMILKYKAVPHFNRDFKKWSGISPARFAGHHFAG